MLYCTDNRYRKYCMCIIRLQRCFVLYGMIWFDLILFFIVLFCLDLVWLASCDIMYDYLAQYAWYWSYLDETGLLMLSIHDIFVTGVICDSMTGSATYGRIISIKVSSLSLSGTLPSSIGNFGSITFMSFYNNKINGTIPSTISDLISLKRLDLGFNLLSGTIPSTMSALTSLRYLSLFNNNLTMGGATSVPISTFSSTTLSGTIYLERNCLAFDTTSPYPERHVTASQCRSTGKYELHYHNLRPLFEYCHYALSET